MEHVPPRHLPCSHHAATDPRENCFQQAHRVHVPYAGMGPQHSWASALGAALGIRGCPRDLLIASRVGTLCAFLLDDLWGPPPAPGGPIGWLRQARQMALAGALQDGPPRMAGAARLAN